MLHLTQARDELGITTLLQSSRDVYILLFTRFVRMFAYGASTLVLALYFAALGYTDAQIGLFMTLTLAGDVLISLALTFVADSLGRRRTLISGALLMSLSGIIFASTTNYWILVSAAVIGVISPSGNEIGPFRAVEESTLAHLSTAATRSDVFAWYVIFGTLGTAAGSIACGWATQVAQKAGWSEMHTFQTVFWAYAGIGLLKAILSTQLTSGCEVQPRSSSLQSNVVELAESHSGDRDNEDEIREEIEGERLLASESARDAPVAKKVSVIASISPASRTTLVKLCGLFFFDSLASGMAPNSLIVLFIFRKFAVSQGTLGTIIGVCQFIASIGNIFASAIAKRIGLVRTMVLTHLPSAVFLAMFPLPSSLALTILLLIARSSLSSMDQAPRSAFLSAVVLPHERTAVMGIVNTVKTMSQTSGPLITGSLAGSGRFWIAFTVAGALKASYDIGMLSMFAGLRLDGDNA